MNEVDSLNKSVITEPIRLALWQPKNIAKAGKAYELNAGAYMLEIRAAGTGALRRIPVRVWPIAATADRSVPCVVDLRDHSMDDFEDGRKANIVGHMAKTIKQVSENFKKLFTLAGFARVSDGEIKNESALRHKVSLIVQSTGASVSDWAAQTVEYAQ